MPYFALDMNVPVEKAEINSSGTEVASEIPFNKLEFVSFEFALKLTISLLVLFVAAKLVSSRKLSGFFSRFSQFDRGKNRIVFVEKKQISTRTYVALVEVDGEVMMIVESPASLVVSPLAKKSVAVVDPVVGAE